MNLLKYASEEEYRQSQIKMGTEGFLDKCIWVKDYELEAILSYVQSRDIEVKFGLCHGSRTGYEVDWFRQRMGTDIWGTDISDVSSLRNVHALDISWTKVTDVSALGKVRKLNLRKTKVVDVSALENVRTLTIIGTKIVDVSTLKNLRTLRLSRKSAADISTLVNVNIKYCC